MFLRILYYAEIIKIKPSFPVYSLLFLLFMFATVSGLETTLQNLEVYMGFSNSLILLYTLIHFLTFHYVISILFIGKMGLL